jgi:hypothetical protein
MINTDILSSKLKYLILMNAKSTQFEIIDVYIVFDTTNNGETIFSYDVDVKFDYQGAIEFDLYSFTADIEKMMDKLSELVSEFMITSDGKLVKGENANCFASEPSIYSIDYEVDTKHIFNLSYKFNYHD